MKHFCTLQRGDDDTNIAFGHVILNPIDDNGLAVPLPSHEELKVTIMRLKNNKATGPDDLPAELFKISCSELIQRMHQFIHQIWIVK